MKRMVFAAQITAALAVAVPLLVSAQQAPHVARIGVLWGGDTAFALPYLQ